MSSWLQKQRKAELVVLADEAGFTGYTASTTTRQEHERIHY